MSRTTRTARRAALVGVSASVALLLAGCAPGATSPGSSSAASPSTSSSASGSTSGVAAKVAAAEKIGTTSPVPTTTVSNASSVKGKTVYYIPITQQAPQFGVTQTALSTALGKVGAKLQVCNGNATPTGIAACLTQATKAQAGAIITDAIDIHLAANAFAAATKAGIPVISTNGIPEGDEPAAKDLGFIYAPASDLMVDVADWIIQDSGGKGSVLINESTDGPAPQAYVAAAQKEFSAECPGCTVTINKISSSNFALIAPSTSSALLKTPGIGYVVSEFDQYLQPTIGGVQSAGKSAAIKGLSGGAQLAGLQMLKNKNFLWAAAGQSAAYEGWADADAAIRMMTGTSGADLPKYTLPIRLFTRANIGSVSLTDADQASGAWFGPTDYPTAYEKLWGVG